MLDAKVALGKAGPPSSPPPRARQRSTATTTTPAAKVLILEDDAIIAMALAAELGDKGFRVIGPVDNGPEAIELAERERPDVIIADVRLRGEMDGIVAARRIKEARSTRVVFASAHIDAVTRAAMEAVGYDAIVAKPYTPEQLIRALRNALGS